MGHQTAVALNADDEQVFLAFLRGTADVAVYRSWSPEPKEVDELSPDTSASPFYFHNKAFPWTPAFEHVMSTDRVTGQAISYYRLIDAQAPVMSYSRHPLRAPDPHVAGRLYWRKDISGPPSYDRERFAAWYSKVVRWVRHNAVKVPHGHTEPWCLPGARRVLSHAR
ncbi:hypothetical protein LZ009_21760 [Ramlibacter sp. XY19]|uniref:hypothetical protein n=1 Tax=Ramlibacter paludis TaxID=2908000 RepID=UPI0023DCD5D0|nr:hypothetical protein [Ramlibacter paludis]MCG2595414.1 hypothetical protein [Ramlibacter paludis]